MGENSSNRNPAVSERNGRTFETAAEAYTLEQQANGSLVLTPNFHPRTAELRRGVRGWIFAAIGVALGVLIAPALIELGNLGRVLFFVIPVVGFIIGRKTEKPDLKKKQKEDNQITMEAEGFSIRNRGYRWSDVSQFYAQEPAPKHLEAKDSDWLNLKIQHQNYLNEVSWMVYMQFGNDPAVPLVFHLTQPQAEKIASFLQSKKVEYAEAA